METVLLQAPSFDPSNRAAIHLYDSLLCSSLWNSTVTQPSSPKALLCGQRAASPFVQCQKHLFQDPVKILLLSNPSGNSFFLFRTCLFHFFPTNPQFMWLVSHFFSGTEVAKGWVRESVDLSSSLPSHTSRVDFFLPLEINPKYSTVFPLIGLYFIRYYHIKPLLVYGKCLQHERNNENKEWRVSGDRQMLHKTNSLEEKRQVNRTQHPHYFPKNISIKENLSNAAPNYPQGELEITLKNKTFFNIKIIIDIITLL